MAQWTLGARPPNKDDWENMPQQQRDAIGLPNFEAFKRAAVAWRDRFTPGGQASDIYNSRVNIGAALSSLPANATWDMIAQRLAQVGVTPEHEQGRSLYNQLKMAYEGSWGGGEHYNPATGQWTDVSTSNDAVRGVPGAVPGPFGGGAAPSGMAAIIATLSDGMNPTQMFEKWVGSGGTKFDGTTPWGGYLNRRPDGSVEYYDKQGFRTDANGQRIGGHYVGGADMPAGTGPLNQPMPNMGTMNYPGGGGQTFAGQNWYTPWTSGGQTGTTGGTGTGTGTTLSGAFGAGFNNYMNAMAQAEMQAIKRGEIDLAAAIQNYNIGLNTQNKGFAKQNFLDDLAGEVYGVKFNRPWDDHTQYLNAIGQNAGGQKTVPDDPNKKNKDSGEPGNNAGGDPRLPGRGNLPGGKTPGIPDFKNEPFSNTGPGAGDQEDTGGGWTGPRPVPGPGPIIPPQTGDPSTWGVQGFAAPGLSGVQGMGAAGDTPLGISSIPTSSAKPNPGSADLSTASSNNVGITGFRENPGDLGGLPYYDDRNGGAGPFVPNDMERFPTVIADTGDTGTPGDPRIPQIPPGGTTPTPPPQNGNPYPPPPPGTQYTPGSPGNPTTPGSMPSNWQMGYSQTGMQADPRNPRTFSLMAQPVAQINQDYRKAQEQAQRLLPRGGVKDLTQNQLLRDAFTQKAGVRQNLMGWANNQLSGSAGADLGRSLGNDSGLTGGLLNYGTSRESNANQLTLGRESIAAQERAGKRSGLTGLFTAIGGALAGRVGW